MLRKRLAYYRRMDAMEPSAPVAAIVPNAAVEVEPHCGPPIGVFEGTVDIGGALPGRTSYNPSSGIYRMVGGGAEVGGGADAFHMAWRRLFGDGGITADISFPPVRRSSRMKAVLLFRQSLAAGAAYGGLVVHGDGHVSLQYRQSPGAVTFTVAAFAHPAGTLRLERHGGRFTALAGERGGQLSVIAMLVLPLRDPLCVGAGVCACNAEELATVDFTRVRCGSVTAETGLPRTVPT